mgnify:CR=1 FL=1
MEEKIIWANLAIQDLENIYDYISENSPLYAAKLMSEIIERTELLVTHPKIGRVIPEKEDVEFREIMHGNYRIMYKIHKLPFIYIYRIIHRSRNFE